MKALAAALMLVCSTASAQYLTGNELLANISSEVTVRRTNAMGYIAGVLDAREDVCVPVGVTVGQATAVVQQMLDGNPQFRHFSAAAIVIVATRRAWPCKPGERL